MASYKTATIPPSSKGLAPRNKAWRSDCGPNNHDRMSSMKAENKRLKDNITRVQNECEELRDESNYQRAKVMELSDIMTAASKKSGSSSSLIAKSKENAELSTIIKGLQRRLRESENKLEEMMLQRRMNNKLLLEMGGIIRTLNMVDIEYDSSTPKSSNKSLSPQEISVQNIKSKVEAMTKDRELLLRRCRDLEKKCRGKDRRMKSMEAKFPDLSKHAVLDESVATLSTCTHTTPPHSPSSSSHASSTLTPMTIFEDETVLSSHLTLNVSDDAAAEILLLREELAAYKQKDEEQANEIAELQTWKTNIHETIQGLEAQNEDTKRNLKALTEGLEVATEQKKNALGQRDEFKNKLRDLLGLYKQLNSNYEVAKDRITQLQSHVDVLEGQSSN